MFEEALGPVFTPSAGISPCWTRAEICSCTCVRSRVVPRNVARQSTRLSAASTASSVTSTFSPATRKWPVIKSATRSSRAAFCKSMSGPAYLLVAAKGRIDSDIRFHKAQTQFEVLACNFKLPTLVLRSRGHFEEEVHSCEIENQV